VSVLLIRHAHAGDRDTWRGDDLARPVSALGRRQGEALVPLLEGRPVTRVVSSQAARAVQTVEPLAARHGVPVERDEVLWETTPVEIALAWLLALDADDHDVAVCSHGDLIGPLLEALAARGVDLGDEPRWDKGSVWVLDVDGDGVRAARYLPPPA
jgi:phosphohistidine phosphatase SixA